MCISPETESSVARVFKTLADGEKNIEVSRQVLNDNSEYDPYQVFQYLDAEGKNRICPVNIIEYLRSKGVYCDSKEAQLIILFYDQDYDGLLSYPEFLDLIQSDQSLRKTSSYSNRNGDLSYNVDYSLQKLLEKEVELARNVISALSSLRLRYDFNIHSIFHSVKCWSCITTDSIKNFMSNNNAFCADSDIRGIFKRLDFNKDGRVDLCEFHAFLGFPNCTHCCPRTACVCCGICCCSDCLCDVPCFYHHCIHHSLCSPCCSPVHCHSPSLNRFKSSQENNSNNVSNNYGLESKNSLGNSYMKNNNNLLQSNNQGSTMYNTFGESQNMPQRDNIMTRESRSQQQEFGKSQSNYNGNLGNSYGSNNFSSSFNRSSNYNASPIVQKVTDTLSLRLSPERKFSPDKTCIRCCCFPCRCCHACSCFPCRCCHTCYCFPCRCCHSCCCYPCKCYIHHLLYHSPYSSYKSDNLGNNNSTGNLDDNKPNNNINNDNNNINNDNKNANDNNIDTNKQNDGNAEAQNDNQANINNSNNDNNVNASNNNNAESQNINESQNQNVNDNNANLENSDNNNINNAGESEVNNNANKENAESQDINTNVNQNQTPNDNANNNPSENINNAENPAENNANNNDNANSNSNVNIENNSGNNNDPNQNNQEIINKYQPQNQQGNQNQGDQEQFNEFLKQMMIAESKIEKAKIDLALRSDFNCEDAFRIFEENGRGYITQFSLKDGLTMLGLSATLTDARILLNRFDLRKTGLISYQDFFDMVVPFEKNYRILVENRPPNSCCPCRCPEIMSTLTRIYLKNALSLILESENYLNNLRNGNASLRMNVEDIFSLIDQSRSGFFNNEDFINYLQNNSLFPCLKDADLLFIRLDKNRNGKIDLYEVKDELEPVY